MPFVKVKPLKPFVFAEVNAALPHVRANQEDVDKGHLKQASEQLAKKMVERGVCELVTEEKKKVVIEKPIKAKTLKLPVKKKAAKKE